MAQNLFPTDPVLLIDDEVAIIASVTINLRASGVTHVISCQDARDVMALLSEQGVSVILLDLTMPHLSGEELFPTIQAEYPEIPVIIVTGNNELENAVSCMASGSFDYMVKPVEKSRLVSGVMRAIEIRELANENKKMKERFLTGKLECPDAFSGIVTGNARMRSLFQYAEAIAMSSQPILITGESGVGKELMAQALHTLSGCSGNFVPVNVAGIDDHVFSDTLFGHRKGAFTGADTVRNGFIEKAAGGVLFLDEIGELAGEAQVKLLRLIQEREYYPLGADLPKSTDAQIIVATNSDLQQALKKGGFRKDLYFRLTAHQVDIPPLRERLDDLPLLLEYFLKEAARDFDKKIPTYPNELITLLKNYHYPGNIRELRGMVFDAVAGHKSKKISMDRFKLHIDKELSNNGIEEPLPNEDEFFWLQGHTSLPTLSQANQMLIREALKRTDNNRTMAARMLGISRQRLLRQIKAMETM